MKLVVEVLGVDIGAVQPQQTPPSIYDGRIRIKITPAASNGFEEITTTVPFQRGMGLPEAVAKALSNLREYGEALVEAAAEAKRAYR